MGGVRCCHPPGAVERPRFAHPSARTSLALQLHRPGQRPHCGQARHRAVASPFRSISIGWMAAVHGKPHSIARRFSRLAPMNLFVSGCPAEEQPARRDVLNRRGCSRKLGAAQLLPLVATAIPGSDSKLRRPEATDQPARRWLSESQPSLVLGINQAVCRDFFRCVLTTDRPSWTNAGRGHSGCRPQVSGEDVEEASGGGARQSSEMSVEVGLQEVVSDDLFQPWARGVPRPMVRPVRPAVVPNLAPATGAPICLCWALPATDPPRTRSNPEIGCCSPPWADGATSELRASTLDGVAP
jgi:hypothetical protein